MDSTWKFVFDLVNQQPDKFKWFIEKIEEREFGYKHSEQELETLYKELTDGR